MLKDFIKKFFNKTDVVNKNEEGFDLLLNKTFDETEEIYDQSVIRSATEDFMNANAEYSDENNLGHIINSQVSGNKIRRIASYRQMANFPEVGDAIDEICDACLNFNESDKFVELAYSSNIVLEDTQKKVLDEEFEHFISLFDFEKNAFNYYRKFVIHGDVVWENIIDFNNTKKGIIGVQEIPIETYEYLIDEFGEYIGIVFNCEMVANASNSSDVISPNVFEKYGLYNVQPIYKPKKNTNSVVVLPIHQITSVINDPITQNQDKRIIYPILERARRAYRQLVLIEDSILIYRLVRAPERLVFNIATGKMPPKKSQQIIQNLMKRYQTKKVYDPTTGDVVNGYNPHQMMECISLDTKINLLDGRVLTLKEIIDEYDQGKENWVYSCCPTTGKFKPGKITAAGITRRNTQVVKVHLDNGKSVIVTPDHKFPIWGKGKIEAQDLKPNDSFITFNQQDKLVYDHSTNTWKYIDESESNKTYNNPKKCNVVKVEWLDEKMDTGNITVDGDHIIHDYHTFALDAGIYTCNCYWFPKSDIGGESSVQTLTTGQNLGELQDLKYFLDKLYVSLKVPHNRFDKSNEIYNKIDTMTPEDFRFAKFVIRIQKMFSRGLEASFKTHLKLRGLWDRFKLNERLFTIRFCPPAAYDLYNSQQLFKMRIDVYDSIVAHDEFSKELAMKKYLGMTEIEIEENNKRLRQEVFKQVQLKKMAENIDATGLPDDIPVNEKLDAFAYSDNEEQITNPNKPNDEKVTTNEQEVA